MLLIPAFVRVGDGAFLADDTMVGGYELGGGWMRVEHVRVGKRAFLGNSGMTAPGRRVPKKALVAVLSAAPQRARPRPARPGSAARRVRCAASATTPTPPARTPRRAGCGWRGRWSRPAGSCRSGSHVLLGVLVVATLAALLDRGPWWAVLLGGLVLLAAGCVAGGVAVLAKWLLVGRMRPAEHPLWSSFVWRNELADTFVEMVAAPWFARAATGTAGAEPVAAGDGRRGSGAACGARPTGCPRPTWSTCGDGATVDRGCVVQTHLFHDRIMSMDRVTLDDGATLGPHCVILPAARIGGHATVGPASLVMRGESVPDRRVDRQPDRTVDARTR